MGFENESNSISIQHHVPILSCTLLVALTLLGSKYILRNWRWTIGCVLIYASIYITLKIAQLSFFESNEICIFIFNNKCIYSKNNFLVIKLKTITIKVAPTLTIK